MARVSIIREAFRLLGFEDRVRLFNAYTAAARGGGHVYNMREFNEAMGINSAERADNFDPDDEYFYVDADGAVKSLGEDDAARYVDERLDAVAWGVLEDTANEA